MPDRYGKGWFVSLSFVFAACGDSGPGPASAVTVRDSAGMEIVENGPPGGGGKRGGVDRLSRAGRAMGGIDVAGPE